MNMIKKEIKLKNGKTCIFRQALEDDAQNILDYLNGISSETDFITYGKGQMNCTLEDEQKYIQEHLEENNKMLIIAEINGKIVGMSDFTGGRQIRIRHIGDFGISVLKKYWDLGIGRTLMESLIEWAEKSGIVRKINLKVRTDNTRAIKIYKSFGFTVEGTISRQLFIDKKFHDAYLMGLNIDP
jgi:ribosomal protein S18 acetylase RimI-like enzyme